MRVPYDKLVPSLKTLLPQGELDALGRVVLFIRRLREIRAGAFVWAVVLSRFGDGRPAFAQARHWYQRLSGIGLFPRPFQMRFKSPATVALFERAFERAVSRWRAAKRSRHPLARAFPDVVVVDSTHVLLPDELRSVFPGVRMMAAAIKTVLTISVFNLVPLHARLAPGTHNDQVLFPDLGLFRRGTLLLFDKGFVAYQRLAAIRGADGHYLCPMRVNGSATIVAVRRAPRHVKAALRRSPHGIDLRQFLPVIKRIGKAWDLDVLLRDHRTTLRRSVAARLVIVPGPNGAQRPYLTTLTAADWPPRKLAELYRLRWQIELVFKELKQHLNLTSVNTSDPHAAQVLVWASLLALALSRVVTAWLRPLDVGLAARFRPALVSRALRSAPLLLWLALAAPARRARDYLRTLADFLCPEAQRLGARDDSFKRLISLAT